jgi:lipopolysaccharide export system protein LptA
MNAKKVYLFVLFVLFAINTVNPCAWAQIGFDKKNILRKNEPIEIVSDKMEAFQEKRMVVFSGNAIATQGDIKIQTDRLYIYTKKSKEKTEKIGKQEVSVSGDIERIELKGHVIITQKENIATGEEAVYFQDSAQIVMTGNPVLRQGSNMIKGCRVVIYIDEKRGRVEKCNTESKERVTAIIQPQDKK